MEVRGKKESSPRKLHLSKPLKNSWDFPRESRKERHSGPNRQSIHRHRGLEQQGVPREQWTLWRRRKVVWEMWVYECFQWYVKWSSIQPQYFLLLSNSCQSSRKLTPSAAEDETLGLRKPRMPLTSMNVTPTTASSSQLFPPTFLPLSNTPFCSELQKLEVSHTGFQVFITANLH